MIRTLALAIALALATPAAAAERLDGSAIAIDGDSLLLGSVEVRLWGINAPEWNEPKGQMATEFMASLLHNQDVRCWVFYHDQYGRKVAQCWVGLTDLARMMIDARLAVDWPYYSGGYYGE